MQNLSLAPALLEAYQGTSFMAIVNGQELSVHLGECCADLERVLREHGARFGVFITAHNPRSELQSDLKNQNANLELERILREQSLHFFDHIGRNGTWSEQGFFVLDLEPDAAVALAETFGQFAVVTLKPGDVAELRLTSLVKS
jgi:6-phosphofructokinase